MPNQLREFAASSNGDRWFLGQEEETGLAYVVHKANEPSGGALTSIDLGAFSTMALLLPSITLCCA